uniref:Uncharacterized protein n=1 Tax=Zea mays TaxID=4577 RepID=A0A804U5Z5_MAIZE
MATDRPHSPFPHLQPPACLHDSLDLLPYEVKPDQQERHALEQEEVEVDTLLRQQAAGGRGQEQHRQRELLLVYPVVLLLLLLLRRRGGGGQRDEVAGDLGRAGARARLLGHYPLQVRDDEGEGPRRRQHVQQGHEGRDVAHHPVRELRLRHEHRRREDDAEEREGVQGQYELPEQEEEEDQVAFLPERHLQPSQIKANRKLLLQVCKVSYVHNNGKKYNRGS